MHLSIIPSLVRDTAADCPLQRDNRQGWLSKTVPTCQQVDEHVSCCRRPLMSIWIRISALAGKEKLFNPFGACIYLQFDFEKKKLIVCSQADASMAVD